MVSLTRAIDGLIYASVGVGAILLPQIYFLVPTWLFYSVLAGWVAYLLLAVATARHLKVAYPFVILLSVLTLVVSLPRPEHYSFAKAGMWLETLTFAVGSMLQIALLILISVYLLKMRKSRK